MRHEIEVAVLRDKVERLERIVAMLMVHGPMSPASLLEQGHIPHTNETQELFRWLDEARPKNGDGKAPMEEWPPGHLSWADFLDYC